MEREKLVHRQTAGLSGWEDGASTTGAAPEYAAAVSLDLGVGKEEGGVTSRLWDGGASIHRDGKTCPVCVAGSRRHPITRVMGPCSFHFSPQQSEKPLSHR